MITGVCGGTEDAKTLESCSRQQIRFRVTCEKVTPCIFCVWRHHFCALPENGVLGNYDPIQIELAENVCFSEPTSFQDLQGCWQEFYGAPPRTPQIHTLLL